MTANETWHAEKLGSAAVAALKGNGFNAQYCANREEALNLVKAMLKPGISVGFGGSMTTKELEIAKLAKEAGCRVLDHSDPTLDAEARKKVLKEQQICDLFIASSNAVTLDGQLVNIDATGNRVAALTFGPSKTLVIAGVNKVVRDVEEALARLEMDTAPRNNKRLDKKNPCVETGYCMDCDEDTRLCRIYSVFRKRPGASDFTVIIIGEALGY